MTPAIEVYDATVRAGEGSTLWDVLLLLPIVELVMLLLVGMSVVSWAIMIQKFFRLSSASRQSAAFLDVFWKSKRLDSVYEQSGQFRKSPVAEVFKAGYLELAKLTSGGQNTDGSENLVRALRRASAVESTQLERYVIFLATTGSTGPFIGLLGTVWGILGAFHKLGAPGQQATIQVVGPDIAEALVATAVGLVAAIPAVMAYNYFISKIRVLNTEMENFSADFLNIVKRHLH